MKRSWLVVSCALAVLPAAVAIAQNAADQAQSNQADTTNTAQACSRTLLADFDPNKGEFFGHDVPIWNIGTPDTSAVMFQSGMTIDADGAPNAYNAQNTGLDDLSNAGEPGHWDGVVSDQDGNPLIQGPNDPFPGFYISQTALVEWDKPRTDPTRYVDASKIPYIVLPGELSRDFGARLGDLAVVVNMRRQTSAFAIFADIGTLGEGSIALANELGVWSDARQGGTRGGILYLVYPGSGNHQPRSLDDINTATSKVFGAWGGMNRLISCATVHQDEPPHDQIAARNFH